PPVQHHRRAVAGAIEIDRLEILVLLQPDSVQHIARQDRKTRAPCTERDWLTDEIANGLVLTVGAHYEHAGAGIHRGQDFEIRAWSPDSHEGFIRWLAGDQSDIEGARL